MEVLGRCSRFVEVLGRRWRLQWRFLDVARDLCRLLGIAGGCDGSSRSGAVAARADLLPLCRSAHPQVRQYAWPIASALHHMHSLGILHRDVKLENVMLTADHRVKLVDFGLCKAIGGGTTATLCGTPQYHPPEIRRGEPYSYPFDAWGLGTTLYALATLKYPQFGTHGELAPRAWRRLACRSRGLVHLLRGLLEPEAARRLRMEQVVQHAFLATAVPADCQALYDAVAGRGGRGVRIPLLGSLYAVLRGALW